MGLLLQPSSNDTTVIEMADHSRSPIPVGIPSQEFATSIQQGLYTADLQEAKVLLVELS
jgi:hypothetical protein